MPGFVIFSVLLALLFLFWLAMEMSESKIFFQRLRDFVKKGMKCHYHLWVVGIWWECSQHFGVIICDLQCDLFLLLFLSSPTIHILLRQIFFISDVLKKTFGWTLQLFVNCLSSFLPRCSLSQPVQSLGFQESSWRNVISGLLRCRFLK